MRLWLRDGGARSPCIWGSQPEIYKSGCLSEHLLQKTFLNISLSLAEIGGGYMTFEKLNEDLCNHGIHLVVGENDLYLYVQAENNEEGALGPEEHTQAVEKSGSVITAQW